MQHNEHCWGHNGLHCWSLPLPVPTTGHFLLTNEPIVLVCYTRQQDGRTYRLLKLLINLIIDENVFLSANDETEVQLSCVGD